MFYKEVKCFIFLYPACKWRSGLERGCKQAWLERWVTDVVQQAEPGFLPFLFSPPSVLPPLLLRLYPAGHQPNWIDCTWCGWLAYTLEFWDGNSTFTKEVSLFIHFLTNASEPFNLKKSASLTDGKSSTKPNARQRVQNKSHHRHPRMQSFVLLLLLLLLFNSGIFLCSWVIYF